jgi:hypothetical protein
MKTLYTIYSSRIKGEREKETHIEKGSNDTSIYIFGVV